MQVELAQYQYLLPRLVVCGLIWSDRPAPAARVPLAPRPRRDAAGDGPPPHPPEDRQAEGGAGGGAAGPQHPAPAAAEKRDPGGGHCGLHQCRKSTLLNAITGAGIPANNRLFDTLDTTTRLLTVSDTLDVVISDTVGFIRKLPHQLVEAFKATLEELEYADLLLHVIDVSNPQWQQQAAIVEDLIHELKADQIPCIRVYNKCDVAFSGERSHEEDAVSISAKTGEGIPALMEAIDRRLDKVPAGW